MWGRAEQQALLRSQNLLDFCCTFHQKLALPAQFEDSLLSARFLHSAVPWQ